MVTVPAAPLATPVPDPPPAPTAKKRRWPWIVLGVIVALVLIGSHNPAPAPAPDAGLTLNQGLAQLPQPVAPAAPVAPVTPPAPAGPLSQFTDGTYTVGDDIAPGTYKTSGSTSGRSCYWGRLTNLQQEGDYINSNNISAGPMVVTVLKADAALGTSGGCVWRKVS